jgi:tetratricopeptide (TPR) repeat protein
MTRQRRDEAVLGSPRGSRQPGRRRGAPVIAAALFGAVLLAAGCSTAGTSSTGAQASALLRAGLKAQAHGDVAQAQSEYRAVLKIDPSNVYAFYDLGVIAQTGRSTDQAANDYQRALAADADYTPALYNLATMEAPTAPKQAAALYEKVVRLDPKDAEAHLNLGLVLKGLGKGTQGDTQIAQAIRLDPSLRGATVTAPTQPSTSTSTSTSGAAGQS